jgi:hypothetical protein
VPGRSAAESDLDLMLVGKELSSFEVMELLAPVEKFLQREVNPSIYSSAEFKRKLAGGNSFLTRVMDQEKIMVKGSVDDFTTPSESGE